MWLIRTIPSLWYRYNADRQVIQCVSHASSYLIKVLKKSTKVAFEIAENAPPYCGVRGAGDVTLTRDGAEEVLSSLLQRYLDGSNASLADWLLSRVDQEYVIEIQPAQVSAWDYSKRMKLSRTDRGYSLAPPSFFLLPVSFQLR